MKLLLPVYALTALFAAAAVAEVAELPTGHPPVDHNAIANEAAKNMPAPDLASMNHGQVVSVINTQGYTYIELSQDEKITWVAVPEIEVKAGDRVYYNNGPAMQNFKSRTLDRTFESVIFLGRVVINADAQ
ncbi:MAG: hypothetical protein KZQ88_16635 [Candidatus Thiodiazotropha sp. (ex Dulcina madagascariensis)]|nr:hypothetical protein [Candidatus Thiodiazotropha sp. (ex Dulcina madagascariensis)]MCU7928931.1 hypothetical protein [Candidatus Thiodiazotropha sp. (ex Dulcina madagascariensis)]